MVLLLEAYSQALLFPVEKNPKGWIGSHSVKSGTVKCQGSKGVSTGWHVVAGAMYARTKPNAPSSILAVPQQASTAEAHDLGRWARLRAPPLLRYEAAGRQAGEITGPRGGRS